ncbi:large conductance mechanosensitive channel protein MscL [Floricoccus penangensis]|uniref:Large-conductance mechanosensitive channel n=1 Tax=Floricoccus penangensis TaxID=1859475 RepID=A0A9Q5JEN8_9LACT|nr:large conductance mechanosensitive channel protein MscL [Floricoccus penangensis]OFI45969.1 mechanosensitive ion channel protein MscL [Floricoccus penangensis]URZ88436.1 large conductance mechanosensitive channel protein MscL [Floricoccus penangensis]
MAQEFKEFIMQGNVLDLAVGVIIGGAFTDIVKSLTKNILTPILGLFSTGDKTFEQFNVKILGATFGIGDFINSVVSFLITAFVIFIIVKGVNKVMGPKSKEEEEKEEIDEQTVLLTEIRDLLKNQK